MTISPIKRFSGNACATWFAAPFIAVVVGVPLMILIIGSRANIQLSISQLPLMFLALAWAALPLALQVGTTGLSLYLVTYWIPVGRSIWLTSAVSAIIFGHLVAAANTYHRFEGDRERVSVPLTKQEQSDRDKYWQDSFLVGAIFGSVAGWVGALMVLGVRSYTAKGCLITKSDRLRQPSDPS